MSIDASDEENSNKKVDSNKKYFDYFKPPKLISLNDYVAVYKSFCKAYDIDNTEQDMRRFSTLIEVNILNKRIPEGVDYKPLSGKARLFITPLKGYVRFHSYSYKDESINLNSKFMKLADDYLQNSKKRKTLEDTLK